MSSNSPRGALPFTCSTTCRGGAADSGIRNGTASSSSSNSSPSSNSSSSRSSSSSNSSSSSSSRYSSSSYSSSSDKGISGPSGPRIASASSGVITALLLPRRTVTRTRASLLPRPKVPRLGSCKTEMSTSSRRLPRRIKACCTASSTLLPLTSMLSTVPCLPIRTSSVKYYVLWRPSSHRTLPGSTAGLLSTTTATTSRGTTVALPTTIIGRAARSYFCRQLTTYRMIVAVATVTITAIIALNDRVLVCFILSCYLLTFFTALAGIVGTGASTVAF